jgi:hypothetical protein
MNNKKQTWISKMTIIGFLLIIINLIFLVFGYNHFELFYFCFPFAGLVLNYLDPLSLFIIILFLQFPAYGFILDKSSKNLKKIFFIIAITHIIAFILAYQNMIVGFK